MKEIAKKTVAAVLGFQIRRLYKKNDFKAVGVVGSIGKTSTKLAIATVLDKKFKAQHQEGNYNHIVTAPLVFFGEKTPSLFNPFAWLGVFWRNEKQLRRPYPYEIVVLELGTDGPGQIAEFQKYLKLEVAVVTSIVPEHMEFFGTLDEVAAEELSVSKLSGLVLANADLCDKKYLDSLPDIMTYAMRTNADYRLVNDKNTAVVSTGQTQLAQFDSSNKTLPELYSMLAAAAVAVKFGLEPDEIKNGLQAINPAPGRLQRLAGINNSVILDDTYNASPAAVKLALSSLYQMESPQKIAILGNMNELGPSSEEEHRKIGEFCDPKHLSMVLTLGPDANKYLAPAAETRGCKVITFDNPYTVGDYLKPVIKPGAIVLAKGSQNGVFAEEALKVLLANPKDQTKLVRQSPAWLKIKQKAFKK